MEGLAYLADSVRAVALTLVAVFGLFCGIAVLWVSIPLMREGKDPRGCGLAAGLLLIVAAVFATVLLLSYY